MTRETAIQMFEERLDADYFRDVAKRRTATIPAIIKPEAITAPVVCRKQQGCNEHMPFRPDVR